jgi:hypothetical protein
MAALPKVEQLLEAVEQLSPAERREFQRRLATLPPRNGVQTATETALIADAKAHLSALQQRRLRRLIAKSETGTLTSKELADYQALAREAEALDAARAQALAELARRWGKSVAAVLEAIGAEGVVRRTVHSAGHGGSAGACAGVEIGGGLKRGRSH